MKARVFKPFVWMIVLVMLLAACGGGATPAPATQAPVTEAPATLPVETEAPVETEEPEPTTEPVVETEEPSGAVSRRQDVQDAVIQIQSEGTFIDPSVGVVFNGAGRGSGFIIDPSGIAVTNNHVVTGAALLKVWVGGDDDKTYNAKILGVSECSDLAVIDIDGSGFPYLEWYDGEIEVGSDMYVAGFPLGDPEYSLTKGVISKARASGETNWSSVDSVIEYDATTNPGNSGGPVITPDGQVLGIHYAGYAEARQSFGISRDIARDVIEELRTGKNLDTIGVNGQAVATEDNSITGVWVSSVESGSPADKAGIEAGDLITQLENLILATDGTMSDYCDILRTHQSGDTLDVKGIRWSTSEVFEGQINGDEIEIVGTIDTTTGSSNSNTGDSSSNTTGTPFNEAAANSGEMWLEEEFDYGVGDWVYFLTSGEDDDYEATLDNSRLRFDIDETDTWIYYLYNPYTFTDVRIDTTAENLGRNNNNVSLICRYDEDRGWYEFNIANSGEYTILRYDARTNEYRALFTGGSTLIKTGKGTNSYTAVCEGDELTLGINGVEVRTVRDSELKEGFVGLSISSFNVTPIIVEFDNFYLSVP